MKNKKKTTKIIRIFSLITIALVFLFLILLVVQINFKKLFGEFNKEEKMFVIEDKCSIMMGNIIHEIKDGDRCKIMCKNECSVRKMSFLNFSFIWKNDSCHVCNCYCR